MAITSFLTGLLNSVGGLGGVTSFVTGVFGSLGLLSDRRLKSDIVVVSWSQ